MSSPYIWGNRCAANGCKSKPDLLKFFRFPQQKSEVSKIRHGKWAECAGRSRINATHAYLCELHFERNQFRDDSRTQLIYGAVPTIKTSDIALPETFPQTQQQESCTQPSEDICVRAPDDVQFSDNTCVQMPEVSCVQRNDYVYSSDNCVKEADETCVTSENCVQPSQNVAFQLLDTDNVKTPCVILCDHTYSKQTQLNIVAYQDQLQTVHTKASTASADTMLPSTNAVPVATPVTNLKPVCLLSRFPEELPNNMSSALLDAESKDVSHGSTSKNVSKKKRRSYIKYLDCCSTKEITPKKKKLIQLIKKKQRSLAKMQKNFTKCNKSVKELCSMDNDAVKVLESLSKSMSVASANFLAAQLRCGNKEPKGRRWTLTDKVMALAVYKKSPKCYTLMTTMFALPSKKTLVKMVSKIILIPGLNAHIFQSLQKTVCKMDAIDRTCIILFDEMSIHEHLQYDLSKDIILGFEDHGHEGRSAKVANHALVFMVKGLYRKWKQPVAFYFTTGNVRSEILVKLLQSVIESCTKVGLNIVVTVCDMASNNTKCLKLLGASQEKPYFHFGESVIYILYDVPHLLKCLRNMLYRHDVIVKLKIGGNITDYTASWSVIRQAYEIDRSQVTYRSLHKLTDCHLDPKARVAMKVAIAAQVLSHSTAAAIDNLVASGKLSASALGTAHFVAFCNKLFDSMNGTAARPQGAGGLKCQLRKGREHFHLNFWEESIDVLKHWKVEKNSTTQVSECTSSCVKYSSPPCISGWITTLTGMKLLWARLKELGFGYLQPRSINQDPIEHLFGCIRSSCGSNTNPTVPQFVSALKSSMINGLATVDLKSNCEAEPEPSVLLNNLQEFISQPSSDQPSTNIVLPTITDNIHIENSDFSVAYVAGSIARRILNKVQCKSCIEVLSTSAPNDIYHSAITFREYSSKSQKLTYPTEDLVVCVGRAATVIELTLPHIAHENEILPKVKSAVEACVSFSWLHVGCALHAETLKEQICASVCRISVPWWCTKRNREISKFAKNKLDQRKLKILKHM